LYVFGGQGPVRSWVCLSGTTLLTGICARSLHDARPISNGDIVTAGLRQRDLNRFVRFPQAVIQRRDRDGCGVGADGDDYGAAKGDRKSTRLNSSHVKISYAVFCLKKKLPVADGRTGVSG